MLYKKNIINIFITAIPLFLFLYSYEVQKYNSELFMILVLIPYINTAIILYKNKNGLIFVYLNYLFFSCLSIPLINLFVENPFQNLSVNTSWYFLESSDKAILVSCIFISAFCFISNILTIKPRVYNSSKGFEDDLKFSYDEKYNLLGTILVTSFFVFLVYQFATGRIPLFSSYENYFSSLSNVPLYGTFLFIYSIGIVTLLVNTDKKNMKKNIFLIMLPGVLLLFTGNRGELLYPILAGLGILITRGMKLNIKVVSIIIIIFFILIPLVGEVRNMNDMDENEIEISSIDSFLTIGYTLRPIVYTVSWIDKGEEFLYGESFYVPFQRGIANRVPGITAIEYAGKAYNYRERLPTMGYSIIAESFHNFGLWGSFILSPLITALFLFGERANRKVFLLLAGGIAAILINNIRNAFAFVPGQIVMLIVLLITFNIVWRIMKRRKENKVYNNKVGGFFVYDKN